MILTILIVFVFLIGSIGLASEGMWLGIVVFGLIAAFLLLGIFAERREWRAHVNRREYWARGGPDRTGTRR